MQPSFFSVKEKVMKNHPCSCHICHNGKHELNGCGFGFFTKGTNCTQVFVFQLSEISQPMLWFWVGRESWLWKFRKFQNLKINCDSFVERCDANFWTCENPPQYHTCTTLKQNCFSEWNRFVYSRPERVELSVQVEGRSALQRFWTWAAMIQYL